MMSVSALLFSGKLHRRWEKENRNFQKRLPC